MPQQRAPGEIQVYPDATANFFGGFTNAFMQSFYGAKERQREDNDARLKRNRDFIGPLLMSQVNAGNMDLLNDPGLKKYLKSMGYPDEAHKFLVQIAGMPQVQAQKTLRATQLTQAQHLTEAQGRAQGNIILEQQRGLPQPAPVAPSPAQYGQNVPVQEPASTMIPFPGGYIPIPGGVDRRAQQLAPSSRAFAPIPSMPPTPAELGTGGGVGGAGGGVDDYNVTDQGLNRGFVPGPHEPHEPDEDSVGTLLNVLRRKLNLAVPSRQTAGPDQPKSLEEAAFWANRTGQEPAEGSLPDAISDQEYWNEKLDDLRRRFNRGYTEFGDTTGLTQEEADAIVGKQTPEEVADELIELWSLDVEDLRLRPTLTRTAPREDAAYNPRPAMSDMATANIGATLPQQAGLDVPTKGKSIEEDLTALQTQVLFGQGGLSARELQLKERKQDAAEAAAGLVTRAGESTQRTKMHSLSAMVGAAVEQYGPINAVPGDRNKPGWHHLLKAALASGDPTVFLKTLGSVQTRYNTVMDFNRTHANAKELARVARDSTRRTAELGWRRNLVETGLPVSVASDVIKRITQNENLTEDQYMLMDNAGYPTALIKAMQLSETRYNSLVMKLADMLGKPDSKLTEAPTMLSKLVNEAGTSRLQAMINLGLVDGSEELSQDIVERFEQRATAIEEIASDLLYVEQNETWVTLEDAKTLMALNPGDPAFLWSYPPSASITTPEDWTFKMNHWGLIPGSNKTRELARAALGALRGADPVTLEKYKAHWWAGDYPMVGDKPVDNLFEWLDWLSVFDPWAQEAERDQAAVDARVEASMIEEMPVDVRIEAHKQAVGSGMDVDPGDSPGPWR